jgi:hypothetical protein
MKSHAINENVAVGLAMFAQWVVGNGLRVDQINYDIPRDPSFHKMRRIPLRWKSRPLDNSVRQQLPRFGNGSSY